MKRQELKLWRPQTFSDHRLTIVARAAGRPALGRDAGAVHSLQHGATILLLLAVAGCAGSPPSAVSPSWNPPPASVPPTAVLTTAPPPSPRPNCGRGRVAGTVVLTCQPDVGLCSLSLPGTTVTTGCPW
jgi:hypothetical protein